MFRFELSIPFISIKSEMMTYCHYDCNYRYVAWHIQVWKYRFLVDWGRSREELENAKGGHKMRLNKEELAIGGIFGGAWAYFTGAWTFLLIPACAVLWALGGSENKLYRRIGVAGVSYALVTAVTHQPWAGLASGLAVFGVLSLGYGIPTAQPKDEGSVLGRFWHRLLRNEALSQAATRATVGLLLGLAMGGLAFISVRGWLYGILLITVLFPLAAQLIEEEVVL